MENSGISCPDVEKQAGMSLQAAINSGYYDSQEKLFIDPLTKSKFSLGAAIRHGVILPALTDVHFSDSEVMNLTEAIDKGIVDTKTCTIACSSGTGNISLQEALGKKVLTGSVVPRTLADLAKSGCILSKENLIINPKTGAKISLEKALKAKVLDPKSLKITDSLADKVIGFSNAILEGIVDVSTGEVKDTASGKMYGLADAMRKGLVVTIPVHSQVSAFMEKLIIGFWEHSSSTISHPKSGDSLTVTQAVDTGLINPDFLLFKTDIGYESLHEACKSKRVSMKTGNVEDFVGNKIVSLKEAVLTGLVKAECTRKESEKDSDLVINQQIGDGLMKLIGLKEVTLNTRILDRKANKHFSVQASLKQGIFDCKQGIVKDTVSGKWISWVEAKQCGFVTELSSATVSLKVAVESGMFDQKSKAFQDTDTGKLLHLEDMVNKGYLSLRNSVILDTKKKEYLSVKEAITKGVIDPNTCEVLNTKSLQKLPLNEAVKKSLILDTTSKTLRKVNEDKLSSVNGDRPADSEAKTRNPFPLSLYQAVNEGYVQLRTGHVILDQDKEITLQAALNEGLITDKSSLIRDMKTDNVHALPESVALGIVDAEMGTVLDTGSGTVLTLSGAVKKGIILNPGKPKLSILAAQNLSLLTEDGKMKSPLSGSAVSLSDAVKSNILDEQSKIISPRDGLPVSLSTAFQQKLLDPVTGALHTSDDRDLVIQNASVPSSDAISLKEAVNKNLLNPVTGKFFDDLSKKELNLQQAITRGLIDPESLILNPATGDKVTISKALSWGMINPESGDVINVWRSKKVRNLRDIIPDIDIPVPVPLDEALGKGLYNPLKNTVIHPQTGEELPLDKAVEKGIIETASLVKDPVSGELMTLKEASDTGVLDLKQGKIKDMSGNQLSLSFALQKGLIVKTKAPLKLSLAEIMDEGLYDESSNSFIDPESKKELCLGEAIKTGLLDVGAIKVRDAETKSVFDFEIAVDHGLISCQDGSCVLSPEKSLSFMDALETGIVIDTKSQPGLSLHEAIEEGLFDSETCQIRDPSFDITMSLQCAIDSGFIDRDTVHIRDPISCTTMTVDGAVQLGIVDNIKGTYRNPKTGQVLTVAEAVEKGLIISQHSGTLYDLVECIQQGIVSPKTGNFVNPKTGASVSLGQAIQDNLVSADSVKILDTASGDLLTLHEALEHDLVYAETGLVMDSEHEELLPLQKALDCGILRQCTTCPAVTLPFAASEGLLDSETGLMFDQVSKRNLFLQEALDAGAIDTEHTLVKDPLSGSIYTLETAIECGIYNVQENKLKLSGDSTLTLKEALDKDILIHFPEKGFTLANAIRLGVVNTKLATVKDPYSGRPLSITEATAVGVIDPDRSKIIDPDTKTPISLKEAIAHGLFEDSDNEQDSSTGSRRKSFGESDSSQFENILVKDPCSDNFISLGNAVRTGKFDTKSECVLDPATKNLVTFKEAVQKGLIIDAQCPDLGLKASVEHGLYDVSKRRFVHPKSGQRLTLQESVESGLVDSAKTRVKHFRDGRFISLDQGMEDGIVSIGTGSLKTQDLITSIPLVKAVREGFVIDVEHSKLSIPEAFSYGLIDMEGPRIEDPFMGEKVNLKKAIDGGLLMSSLTLVKDPSKMTIQSLFRAVESGLLDITNGTVFSSSDNIKIGFLEAIESGLFVDSRDLRLSLQETVQLGLFDRSRGTFHDPRDDSELLLPEAIEKKLVESNQTLIRNPVSGSLIPLDEALEIGVLDPVTCSLKNPKTDKVIPLKHALDKGFVVDGRSPHLSLKDVQEQGLMDEASGMIIDPKTGSKLTIKEAVSTGLVNPNLSCLQIPGRRHRIPLDKAIKEGIVNGSSGKVQDQSGKTVSLWDAVASDLVFNPNVSDYNQNEPTDKSVGHPHTSNQRIKRQRAIDSEYSSSCLSLSSSTISSDYTLPDAFTSSDGDSDSTIPAFEFPCKSKHGLSLTHSVVGGLCDVDKGTMIDPKTGKSITIAEALKTGIIKKDSVCFRPRPEDSLCFYDEASSSGMIDEESGKMVDIADGKLMSWREAMDSGFIAIPANYKISLDALKLMVQDSYMQSDSNPDSSKDHQQGGEVEFRKPEFSLDSKSFKDALINYFDPHNGQLRQRDLFCSIRKAIEVGHIKADDVIVFDPASKVYLSWKQALKENIINADTGVMLNKLTGKVWTLAEAVESNLIIDLATEGINPADLIIRNALSDDMHFTDPRSGQTLTLTEALDKGICDGNKCDIYIPELDTILPMKDAMDKGYIDGVHGFVTLRDLRLPLREALCDGVLCQTDAELSKIGKPLTFCCSVDLGYYDNESVSMVDPGSGKKTPLSSAWRQNTVDTSHTYIKDFNSNKFVPFGQAVKSGILNVETGCVSQSQQNKISLGSALKEGLIVSLTFPMPLFEAVVTGIYQEDVNSFSDPRSRENQTLGEAMDKRLLDGDAVCLRSPTGRSSPRLSRRLTLREAVDSGLVDPDNNTVKHPSKDKNVGLAEAVSSGIVMNWACRAVSKRTDNFSCILQPLLSVDMQPPASLGDKMTSRSAECLAVPQQSSWETKRHSLLEVSDSQVIDPDTCTPITLKRAASLGMIDIKAGEFKHPQSDIVMALDEAIKQGFVICPTGSSLYTALNHGLYDERSATFWDPSLNKYVSLDEAIASNFINPKFNEIRDLTNDTIITLQEALKKGLINPETGTYNDMLKGKCMPFRVALAGGLIIGTGSKESLRDRGSSLPRGFGSGEELSRASSAESLSTYREQWKKQGWSSDQGSQNSAEGQNGTVFNQNIVKQQPFPKVQITITDDETSESISDMDSSSSTLGAESDSSREGIVIKDIRQLSRKDSRKSDSSPKKVAFKEDVETVCNETDILDSIGNGTAQTNGDGGEDRFSERVRSGTPEGLTSCLKSKGSGSQDKSSGEETGDQFLEVISVKKGQLTVIEDQRPEVPSDIQWKVGLSACSCLLPAKTLILHVPEFNLRRIQELAAVVVFVHQLGKMTVDFL